MAGVQDRHPSSFFKGGGDISDTAIKNSRDTDRRLLTSLKTPRSQKNKGPGHDSVFIL
jgi:hypothetical protein